MKNNVDKKTLFYLRKVDDIGRVTLPRHIREFYNINNGDTVEVLGDENGQFIIRKHKPQEYYLVSSEKIIEGFNKATGIPIVLCDRDEIISTKGIKEVQCVDLSKDFFAQIRRKDDTIYPDTYLNQDKTLGVKDFRFIVYKDEYVGAVVIPACARELSDADKTAFEVCVAAIAAYLE